MSAVPQYSPAQILDMGQRAEQEGNLQHAAQFYNYIVDNFADTIEAAEARLGADRVERAATASTPATPPPAHAHPPAQYHDVAPTTAPPRPHDASTRPVNAYQNQHRAQASPATTHPPQTHRAEPALNAAANRTASPSLEAGNIPPPRPNGQAPSLSPHNHNGEDADDTPLPRVMRRDEDLDEEDTELIPGFRVGRFLAFSMLLIGWLALVGGIVFIGTAVAGVAGTQILQSYGALPLGVVVGGAAMAAGIIFVFVGSLAGAVFEAANNTRELLEIERAKAGW